MPTDRQTLDASLAAILPGAQLAETALPEVPQLRLLLLAADYPQGELSPEAMQRVMDNPLYWVFCWASGQVLARYLLDNPDLVQGKRVLDFGSGSGVVAVAAAMAGAAQVVACDIDPLALAATRVNAGLNGVSLDLVENYFDVQGEIDIIIVADVLYDRENFPWLGRFVERAQQVLIADSRVKHFDFPPYRQIAQRQSCTLPDLDESAEFRDVRLYAAQSSPAE
ncbi:class I SAM-dependent methyltransferase [Pseudohalioglobus lutimaris]|uniref:Methyltransferase n=1 Tax=Pseudohalioglobus lutimaris TaxID=1737061 RepID=A0A2N5X0U0_9GAMM|nr:50S ribosomal protein L11 methyltransferase [Pseudohalioglobus lutimaris]PLW68088.1 methyltransferase [Pseudohalioglobus lutimaris]